MEPDNDEIQERLIEFFKPRLRELIDAEQVLDLIDFIPPEEKEQIRQKARCVGNRVAVDRLIAAVVRRPHSLGWFTTFADALRTAGFLQAHNYIQLKLPNPEEEAESDHDAKLINLLTPSLTRMKTSEVALHCRSENILTEEDYERVRTETDNNGSMRGARELLSRIVRSSPGWFSIFVQILRETEHNLHDLFNWSADPEDGDDKQSLLKKGRKGDGAASGHRREAEENCESLEVMECSATEEGHMEDTDGDGKQSLLKKGRKGDGAASGYRREAEENCESLEVMEWTVTEEGHMEDTDQCVNELPNLPGRPGPDGCDSGAAASSPGEAIVLRDYQMDVARPALEGENIIICLPTGSGKTRVAVYITKKHLDSRRAQGKSGKVVVLVNKVPLVEQHYSAEFLKFLKKSYRVERVSGDSQLKISFTEIVDKNDIIICTAQILENFLERSEVGEDEGVKLSDLTLMVIDECHHTQKGEVYNHIMMRYLKQKHKNIGLRKEQREPVPLPQILGLTASPGVGGATKMDKAVDNILRICANLDASKIMTVSLGKFKKEQRKGIETVEDRKEDPFGDVIKKIMTDIHAHADLSPTCELGSQNYEQWVVQNERKAAKEGDRSVRVCANHLQQYSESLNLCNTIRMCDALNFLSKFYEEEMKKKTAPDEEHDIQITKTERFLFRLFQENKQTLERLAKNPDYENDSLSKLRGKILKEFSRREKARGIIFTKTRRSAIALNQWVQENSKFDDIGVKPSYVIGGGDQSVVKPMTTTEQKEVLKKFANGDVNLLIATTVAEEGLDIPACNFVIRYGLVTNEIAMIQAQGRGRAEDSTYTLVEVKNSGVVEKEFVNEFRCSMMDKAIGKIGALDQKEYKKRITEFQLQAIMEAKVFMEKKKQRSIKNQSPADVVLRCRGCNKHVCGGGDIQIIENMHRVNVTSEFEQLFIRRENTNLQERMLDYETNGYIACKSCGERWGSMMMYRGIECPCLHVKNFVVNIGGKNISKCTKWKEVPIKFSAFDYIHHASQMAHSSDDEENI